MLLKDQLVQQAATVFQQALLDRRHLHTHPELSFHEYQSAAFIKERLDKLGIPWKAMANTGVVGYIAGGKGPGKVVALRADIDALPITEKNDLPYRSVNEGVMHACGHDFHTASLLGVAAILQQLQSAFSGGVKLIFQPGEEKLPGGASLLIGEGVLLDPVPDIVIGQHAAPFIPAGSIGVRSGVFMASMDEIVMDITGKGGHGAMPHRNIDPVLVAAAIVLDLQQVVSRFIDPLVPSVLSVGRFIAAGAINIIPDQVHLEGTFRTMDVRWRHKAHEQIRKIAEGVAASMNASCEVRIREGYPVLYNHPAAAAAVKASAIEYLGAEKVTEAEAWMAAEDFAYYSQHTNACFYLIGTAGAENTRHSLHSPSFNIEEDVLRHSTGLMAYMALQQLGV